MRAIQIFSALVLSLFCIGCSTTINTRQALDRMAVGTLKYDNVDVTAGVPGVQQGDIVRLKTALTERLAKIKQGTAPVKIEVRILEVDIHDEGDRILAGALVGSNTMIVAVKVLGEAGQTIADFDVQRSANPGGYGAFYDQRNATANAVADGIVEVLSGMK